MKMRTITSVLLGLVLACVLFVAASVIEACAAFQKAVPFLPPPDDTACVITEVEKGIEDPAQVVKDCNLLNWALDDVIKMITGAKKAKAARLAGLASDGGPPDAGK